METLLPSNSSETFTENDIVDFLNEDDSKVIEEKKDDILEPELKKEEKEETEEVKLDDEIEDEETEPTEDDLELVTPVRRKEILKEFPELFKKFPYLEKAYYREQKYTEILPTIEDAQEAVEARDTFKKFEIELLSGNTETVLKTIKDTDEKAFAKVVDSYLPTLARVDKNAYFHIIGNISKNLVVQMVKEAQNTKNEDLQNAALLVNQFVFGTSDFKPSENFSKEPTENPEADKLKKERQEFISERFTTVRDDLQTRTDNVVKSTIANHIDPRKVMTDYVRKNAIREAQDFLTKAIDGDNRFQILKDKLWEKAFQSNFSRQAVEAIRSAYLSKAKTLLPEIIKKSRNEALKGLGKRVVDDSEKEDQTPLPVGKTASPRSTSSNKSQSDGKGKKTIDFFNED